MKDLLLAMRGHKNGIEARSAILEGQERVDIIRGKDFVRWVRAHFDTINLAMVKGM